MVSYRLGGADGVAVEARKWEWALHQLGFRVRRVAGELDDGFRPDDTWLPFLAIEPQVALAPTGSNGQTTDVSTYNTAANWMRRRLPFVVLRATRAFAIRS